MTAAEAELWKRISEFPLDDPGSSMPFSRRLAKENGWSHDHALRVIGEYKRFLFLVATSGHFCTPSDAVDQAWHLHLCYTRSYWHDLCRDVIGREIHHGPTKGGAVETARYRDAYAATLARYRTIFETDPDPEIWPPVDERFRTNQQFRRIDLAQSWVVRRPNPILVPGILFGAMAAFLIACRDDHLGLTSLPEFGFLFLLGMVVFLMILSIRRKCTDGRRGRRGGDGCSGFVSSCGTSGCGGSSSHHDNDSNADGGDSSGCGADSGCGGGCGGGGD